MPTGRYFADGRAIRRIRCGTHHNKKYNMKAWKYKQHRKDFCENIDGRLGYFCTATIVDTKWQLGVDHIDGTPNNDNPNNLQTLCHNCHSYKTKLSRDHLTPGRKSLKTKEK